MPARGADQLPPVCVLAGGRGVRLGELTHARPKAMVTVAGRPFVEHQLELLRSQGARRVVLCVDYLAEQLESHVGDGKRFGLEVGYSYDDPGPAGTAGAVRHALPLLGNEFLVLYGDTYLPIDFRDVAASFRNSDSPAQMTVLRNRDKLGPSNAVYRDGLVIAYDKRLPPVGAEWIDYGLLAFDASVLEARGQSDLADVTRELSARNELAGYEVRERFYEIGTPVALAETEAYLASSARRASDY